MSATVTFNYWLILETSSIWYEDTIPSADKPALTEYILIFTFFLTNLNTFIFCFLLFFLNKVVIREKDILYFNTFFSAIYIDDSVSARATWILQMCLFLSSFICLMENPIVLHLLERINGRNKCRRLFYYYYYIFFFYLNAYGFVASMAWT